jgi:hypothetical protein
VGLEPCGEKPHSSQKKKKTYSIPCHRKGIYIYYICTFVDSSTRLYMQKSMCPELLPGEDERGPRTGKLKITL